jgi:homogentisate 1,2-dioxygenase
MALETGATRANSPAGIVLPTDRRSTTLDPSLGAGARSRRSGSMANRHYLSYPLTQGRASRQAHADFPAGTYERELGKEGFFGPATHMYHTHPPTGWVDWEGPLRPRCFDLNRIEEGAGSPWDAAVILHNAQVKLAFWRAPTKMDHLARNADGDQLIFVHEGAGDLYCDYGHLEFQAGDYLVLPRSTMWRLECATPVKALLIEATGGSLMLPDKGMIGRHAVFDPAMLDVPRIDEAFLGQQGEVRTRVRIKRGGAISTVTYPFNPLDAVGWSGDLAVARINVKDLRPLMSHRYHLPPSAHTTFVGPRFVVCTFCPRPLETDPGALKLPFFHNNDDFDEVLFYHAGDFTSRDNIEAGMVTFHPCGFTHGPHPKALRGMFEPKRAATDEYAVMLDSRDALEVGEAARAVENRDYVNSWRAPGEPAPKAPSVPAGDD